MYPHLFHPTCFFILLIFFTCILSSLVCLCQTEHSVFDLPNELRTTMYKGIPLQWHLCRLFKWAVWSWCGWPWPVPCPRGVPHMDHRPWDQTAQGHGRICCLLFAYTKKLLKAGINRAGESIRIIRVYTTQWDYLTVTGMASQEWLAIRTVGLNTATMFTQKVMRARPQLCVPETIRPPNRP